MKNDANTQLSQYLTSSQKEFLGLFEKNRPGK